jgi:hypothetical protein
MRWIGRVSTLSSAGTFIVALSILRLQVSRAWVVSPKPA